MSPLESLFLRTPNLPSIPRVVQELIVSLRDDLANLEHVISQVRQDQSLSARVLRLANSGYYGSRSRIGAIDEAVTRIGVNALRTLVIASGIAGAFPKVPGVDLKAFFRHAILTAGIARELGRMAKMNGELAYTAGLMHRIGQLVIHLAGPNAASQIAQDAKDQHAAARAAREQELLGVTHCEAGAELARRWQFPELIEHGIRHYCQPTHPDAPPLAGVIWLAADIATRLEAGQSPAQLAAALDAPLLDTLGLAGRDMEAEVDRMAERLMGADTCMV